MIPVTLDGLAQYAWPYEPEWGSGVRTIFGVEADAVDSLTKRENRRAYGETLRVETQATYRMNGATASAVRNALRILQDTPVRLPFLPGLDDTADFGARWYLAFDPDAQNLYWTLGPADNSGRAHIIATGMGYLVEPPTFDLITTDTFDVKVRWKDSSPNSEALALPAQAWAAGPSVNGRTVYQFPFLPAFQAKEDAGSVTVEVDRKQIGFVRQWGSAAYPQLGYRGPAFAYQLFSQFDAAVLLRFFLDRKGTVEPFWLPCMVEECKLAADVAPGDTTITVTDATALGDQRYILLYDGESIYRQITNIAGNVLTLDSAAGAAFSAGATIICTLALARFASNQVTVDWTAPDISTCKIGFQEVTQEYSTAIGETYGTSLGPLPAKSYLFTLVSEVEVWRWTSYEKDLTDGVNTYLSTGIDFSEIIDGLAWDATTCKLNLRSVPNHPLARLVSRTATDRFALTVAEAVPTTPVTGYTVIFQGWITGATFTGPWVEADATAFGSLFTRMIPRTLMQPTDNYALFDAGNRLTKASWTFTARLASVAGWVFTLDTLTWPQGALPAIADNYFALGYIQRPNPLERVPIGSSTAIAGGVVTVTLAHSLMNGPASPPEAGWLLVPGYDGLLTTAVAKFNNNIANFGGFPECPDTDPSMVPVNNATGTANKKG